MFNPRRKDTQVMMPMPSTDQQNDGSHARLGLGMCDAIRFAPRRASPVSVVESDSELGESGIRLAFSAAYAEDGTGNNRSYRIPVGCVSAIEFAYVDLTGLSSVPERRFLRTEWRSPAFGGLHLPDSVHQPVKSRGPPGTGSALVFAALNLRVRRGRKNHVGNVGDDLRVRIARG